MISTPRLLMTALLIVCLLPAPVKAQEALPLSTAEDVAIAFFKAGHTNPDFDKWAKGTREYKIVAPVRAEDYVAKEKQRLIKKWQSFNLDSDILNIRSTITVHLKQGVDDKGNETYAMEMAFDKNDAPYFPFEFQDYKFAVIPQKMGTFQKQPLTKEQFALLYADFEQSLTATAYLMLQMKAAKSYIQQPYDIDGVEQWVLLADPVTLALKSYRTGADLWTHGASWYVSPAKQEVRELYQIPDKGAPIPQSP